MVRIEPDGFGKVADRLISEASGIVDETSCIPRVSIIRRQNDSLGRSLHGLGEMTSTEFRPGLGQQAGRRIRVGRIERRRRASPQDGGVEQQSETGP